MLQRLARSYSTKNGAGRGAEILELLNLTEQPNRSSQNTQFRSPRGGQGAGFRFPFNAHTVARAATPPPRTGVLAGRSMAVNRVEELPKVVGQVNHLNRINRVPQTVRLQRFAERPGKERLRIRVARKKRDFNQGVRRLFDLIREARRRGL